MVRPVLEYGNAIWGPFFQCDIKTVESVQRRATKLIPHLSDLSYEERLHNLKLPSLAYRRKRGDMILMYKIINEKIRIQFDDFFTLANNRTRGHPMKVTKLRAMKLSRINSFSQRVVNDWNSLPEDVVMSPSLNTFKNRLDKHWKQLHYKFQ